MIPRADVEVSSAIPPSATFWVPRPSEITEEGFGFFRDVWPIVGARSDWTNRVLEAERALIDYLDRHSPTEDDFYELATSVEAWLSGDNDDENLPGVFPPPGLEPWPGFEGLDIGVAGLSIALANAGFYPAASSRGGDGWAEYPVVFFAADSARVDALAGLLDRAGCGFSSDINRAELLLIEAPSVVEASSLASLVFERRATFRAMPKTNRKQLRPQRQHNPAPPSLF